MTKFVYFSSTPIKLNIDPVTRNTNTAAGSRMTFERIYHSIYLTSIAELCSPDDLKIYGFTHIIYIDKHIIENNSSNTHIDIRQMCSENRSPNIISTDKCFQSNIVGGTPMIVETQPQVNASFGGANGSDILNLPGTSTAAGCSSSFNQDMPIDDDSFTMLSLSSKVDMLNRGDFEILDLNFGETSYLTTVLPNCYKAVKFIEKATKQNGAVLVIDCIGGSQKCITIVIGFLMYKYNKNFM